MDYLCHKLFRISFLNTICGEYKFPITCVYYIYFKFK